MSKDEKKTLLANIRRDRATLDELIASLSEAQFNEPALEAGWSVKDALAHVTAWEQRLLSAIRSTELGQMTAWPAGGFTPDLVDRVNNEVYAANHDRPASGVLADARRSYADMLATVERLSCDDVLSTERWSFTNGRPLLLSISANSDDHYREHIDQIREWLA